MRTQIQTTLPPVKPKTSRALDRKPEDLAQFSQTALHRYCKVYGWDTVLEQHKDGKLCMRFSAADQARSHFDFMRKQDYYPMSAVLLAKSPNRRHPWIVEVSP